MTNNFLKNSFIIVLGFILSVAYLPRLSAEERTSKADDFLDMVLGDLQTVSVKNLTRVSVTNPDVADISDAEADKVSVIAKKAGSTVLFLWDEDGKHSINVRVANEDLTTIKERIQKLLNEAGVTGVLMEENHDIGKVVLSGSLSKDNKNRVDDVLQPYSDSIYDLIKEEKSEDLIQVDMQIVEISTSLEKNLGILWGDAIGGSGTGSTGTSGTVQLGYQENLPGGDKFKDLFKIGNFQRTTPLQATVNALIQEGKARLISKPRLVVVSGKRASFLVGGEIPVESTTVSTAGSTLTSNTTYAQYGVNLSVTPTMREGKIDVILDVDIRDIDASNSSNGNTAFITRTASTNLFMDNKQTIVLAGLIKYTDSEQISEVPFLSKVPLLGAMFRNRATPTPDANTEMVIILTPTVLKDKKYADKEIVMPTPEERGSFNEFDAKYEHESLNPAPIVQAPALVSSVINSPEISTEGLPEMTAYARMVQEKISRSISYPNEAIGQALAGTVKLKLHILKDGTLESESVMESSGVGLLDQDALKAAKRAAPYDAFTPGIDQDDLIFTIPIVYNKLILKGQASREKVIASY